MNNFDRIHYRTVKSPVPDCTGVPVLLTDETMKERYHKVMSRMQKEGLDTLVIYADLEHGNNFEYLTGFLPALRKPFWC